MIGLIRLVILSIANMKYFFIYLTKSASDNLTTLNRIVRHDPLKIYITKTPL